MQTEVVECSVIVHFGSSKIVHFHGLLEVTFHIFSLLVEDGEVVERVMVTVFYTLLVIFERFLVVFCLWITFKFAILKPKFGYSTILSFLSYSM